MLFDLKLLLLVVDSDTPVVGVVAEYVVEIDLDAIIKNDDFLYQQSDKCVGKNGRNGKKNSDISDYFAKSSI